MEENDTKTKVAVKNFDPKTLKELSQNADVSTKSEVKLTTREVTPTRAFALQNVADPDDAETQSSLVSIKTECRNTTGVLSSEPLSQTSTTNEQDTSSIIETDNMVSKRAIHLKERPILEESFPSSKVELPVIICTQDKSLRDGQGDNLVDFSVVNSSTLTITTQQDKSNISEESEHCFDSQLDSLPPSPTTSTPDSSRLPSPTLTDHYLSPDFTTPNGSPKVSDKDQDDDTASVATQDEETLDPIREKRYAALKILREIELDFAKLRQRLYCEKIAELDKEIDYINDGTHPSLKLLLEPTELKKRQRVTIADCLRRMQILTISNMCTAMEYQISCEYQEKVKGLKHSIAEGIGSKRIKLFQEWCMTEDTSYMDQHAPPTLKKKARLRGTNLSARKIAKSMSLTSLEQSEIDQDLAILSGLHSY